MNKRFVFLIFVFILPFFQTTGQVLKEQFNYEQGSVTLKNGTILISKVANIKHGFRDELLIRIRFKPSGKILARKFHPRKILAYSMGERQFVSWRVKRNNALFKETYTIHVGNEYKIFKIQNEGLLSIYLEYFVDDDLWIRSVPYFLKKNDSLMVRATQGLFGLKTKLLTEYLSECPQLVELIEVKNITTPEEVAILYNNCLKDLLNTK